MIKSLTVTTSVCALGVALASPAFAQTKNVPAAAEPSGVPASSAGAVSPSVAPQADFQDIIVTAEKKRTNLQRTPIAITALSGAALATQQVQSVADIQGLVPGFQFSATAGFANFTLRGIGINVLNPLLEGSVAVHLNDVYVARGQSQLAGFYDVSSIEVLRGPQGTLYGRNATAGSVNIYTNMPTTKWSGYANLTAGNYGTFNAEAAISGPIVGDKLTFRLAGISRDRSGYGKNIVTGHDIDDQHARAIRATLLFKPSSNLTATLIGEYFREKDASGNFHYFGKDVYQGLPGQAPRTPFYVAQGGYINTNILDETSDIDPEYYLKTVALTGKIEWRPMAGLTLRSITGYRDQKNFILASDGVGHPTPGYVVYGEPAHQFTEELQANYASGPLDMTAGLYYFNETDTANPLVLVENAAQFGGSVDTYLNFFAFPGSIQTKSKAAFAQGTIHITDELSLTAGIRYSHDHKRFVQRSNGLSFTEVYVPGQQFPVSGIRTVAFNSWTPKFGIQYQVTPRVLVYASYSKGFKSGGFDPDDTSATGGVVKPEQLTDYEGGVKITSLGGRARLNLAAFKYDYKNLQLQTSTPFGNLTIVNADAAKLYGGEAEFSIFPTRNLQLNLTGAYLHTRYGNYLSVDSFRTLLGVVNFKGNALTNAPKFMASAAAEYTYDLNRGALIFRGELNYSSKVYLRPNNLDATSQNANAKINGFLTYRDQSGWNVGAFVRNLTNKITKTSLNTSAGSLNGAISPPRTFGVTAGYKF